MSGAGEVRTRRLSRREFLRLCGLNAAGILFPTGWIARQGLFYDREPLSLPEFIAGVIDAMPDLTIDQAGKVLLRDPVSALKKPVPLVATQWNRERRHSYDRLETGKRWGIVLHWFGDRGPGDQTLDAYLRGFDAMRPVFNYETRTSTHFLVGDSDPAKVTDNQAQIGIVQTQMPDSDGTPFLGSHLQALDYSAHLDRRQYFVQAFRQLESEGIQIDSILEEFFESQVVIDPNLRTIAVDVTGYDFDAPGSLPGMQKIANTTALVWALMKRYRIRAVDILGHHELQLGKSDPGKKFIALIRLLVGIAALLEGDPIEFSLVSTGFGGLAEPLAQTTSRYLRFVRRHLAIVGTPRDVFEWEATCGFWNIDRALGARDGPAPYSLVDFQSPVDPGHVQSPTGLSAPPNHEGFDLLGRTDETFIRSVAGGTCLFVGAVPDPHWGKMAMFGHRRSDGTELVSIYGHLDRIGQIEAGRTYPEPVTVGGIVRTAKYRDPYLHFALAYGATWDLCLNNTPIPPANAGEGWIQERYLDPVQLLHEWSGSDPKKIRKVG